MRTAQVMLKGEVFGRLLVLKEDVKHERHRYWICRCVCGNVISVRQYQLTSGRTKSCRCYVYERLKEVNTIHGGYGTPEYSVWSGMKRRCCVPTDDGYKYYGAKGVIICERWLNSFSNFLEDMGKKPTQDHTIDRINTKGNYEPDNCRWATWSEQNKNRDPELYARGWETRRASA